MKVFKPGLFVWSPESGIVTGAWQIDMEGTPLPATAEILACMLNHIASASGLTIFKPVDPDVVAGLAEDAIERARKAGL